MYMYVYVYIYVYICTYGREVQVAARPLGVAGLHYQAHDPTGMHPYIWPLTRL